MDYETVRRQVSDLAPMKGGGASDQEIAQAEAELGTTFPDSYRAFLGDLGWMVFNANQYYGLGSDVPDFLDLIKNTLDERTSFRPYLPPTLIPVFNDGGGNHYCLDKGQLKDGECPVVFWNHELEEDQQPDFVAASFAEWLAAEILEASEEA